jgi:cytochrome c5
MSDTHHHDAIQDNIETHPLKLAIAIVGGAVAMIVGIMLLVQFAIGSYGARSLKDEATMKPEVVASRIAPVAKLALDPNAPAPAVAPAAGAPVAVAAVAIPKAPAKAGGADAGKGKALYDTTCMACHAAGVAGAPKFGDKAAWAPRIKTGVAALYEAVLKGKGAMPPKGGSSAADADLKAAVDYMVAAAK